MRKLHWVCGHTKDYRIRNKDKCDAWASLIEKKLVQRQLHSRILKCNNTKEREGSVKPKMGRESNKGFQR